MKIVFQKPGIRYLQNQPPLFMKLNLWAGKCWCGKPKKLFEKFMRKYCCNSHANMWYFQFSGYWPSIRSMIIKRDNSTCQDCGLTKKQMFEKNREIKESNNKIRDSSYSNWDLMKSYIEFEVDHILAIILGGFCFDLENLRTLCNHCHKKKTKSDMAKLKAKRRKLIPLENFEN